MKTELIHDANLISGPWFSIVETEKGDALHNQAWVDGHPTEELAQQRANLLVQREQDAKISQAMP